MKREELECPVVDVYYGECEYERFKDKYYYKDEADSVMDAMEQRIKELEETKSKMYDANQLMNARIKELEATISKLETTQKWISIKDRLPDEYGDYLVSHKNWNEEDVIDVYAYAFDSKAGYACWVDDFEEDTSVTHWMPLPPTTEDPSVTEKEK